jgi:hypothetical protein
MTDEQLITKLRHDVDGGVLDVAVLLDLTKPRR